LYRSPLTPELAAFVGEAVLLQGEARDGRIACELGQLIAASSAESSASSSSGARSSLSHSGPVTVMIRPEQIRLQARHAGSLDAASSEFGFGYAGPNASAGFAPDHSVGDISDSSSGCLASVEKVVFYGHDASVDLRLQHSGLLVRIRIAGYLSPRIGERVRLAVEGPVQVYPSVA